MQKVFGSIYWHPTLVRAIVLFIGFVAIAWLALEVIEPAPPSTITIATSLPGGGYEVFGHRYQKVLADSNVTLNTRHSNGSVENLQLLKDPKSGVQIAFVQGGVSNRKESPGLLSLGRIYYQPFWIFYRGPKLDNLAELKNKHIGVGAVGSGTQVAAKQILGAAGVNSDTAFISPLGGPKAVKALYDGKLDAVFLAYAPEAPIVQQLIRDRSINLMNISQSEALTRIFPNLVQLVLPQGVIDFENDIPSSDVHLVGTTNSILVRDDLHPEIVTLLARTLAEVHREAGLFQRADEFPKPTDPEYAVADGARDYYMNGPSLLNRYLPFWAVNIIKKLIGVTLAVAVIFLPLINYGPRLVRWLIRDRMRNLYRQLRTLETEIHAELTAAQLAALQSHLEKIDGAVNSLGVPVRYSDLFFALKIHINLVRQRLGMRRAALQSEPSKGG